MALPIFNWNGGQAITVSGNFCPIVVPITQPVNQGQAQNQGPMIDLVTYYIAASTATGNINFQELAPDRVTWLPLVVPATIALAGAGPFNGSFTGPFLGVRIVVSALAVSTVSIIMIKGTIRS